MAFFLGVVAAVLLVLALAVAFAFWWLKRWLRRKVGDLCRSAEIVDPRFARPARLELELAADADASDALRELWTRCHALGFRLLADWHERHGAFALLRAARHESLPIALVLTQTDGNGDAAATAAFAMFVLTRDNRLTALSDAQGPALVTSTMTWDVAANRTPEAAFAQLEPVARTQALREPELRLIAAVYERAWASRIDVDLARGPDRAALEARAAGRTLTPAQVDQALDLETQQWHAQLAAAVLDRWRRASRVDAVRWERLRDDVHVVHDKLRDQDVARLLDADDVATALIGQFVAQGLSGIALYEKVVERLPAAQRRERLGTVDRPLRAVVFGRAQAEADAAPALAHAYEAVDDDGRAIHGAVLARDSTDARRQLDGMGLADAKILSEPAGGVELPTEFAADPELAAFAARAMRESIGVALLRAVWANKWLWAPPLLLLAWSLRAGSPWGWGDYLVFAYAALAGVALVVFIAPMVLYNEFLRARVRGRWRTAGLLLGALSLVDLVGGLPKTQLAAERAKLLAARGDLDGALARWKALEPQIGPDEYAAGLVSIYDGAGDHARMIAAQRDYLERAPAKEMATVDLALSLARYERDVEQAESLLARTSPQNLSELALGGYHFARGLICAERGQAELALRQFAQAMERVAQFRTNPLIACLIAEINGYVALTLKQAGRRDQADEVWASVRDILAVHSSCRGLVARYEQA